MRPSIVRNSLLTTSDGRLSCPSGPGAPPLAPWPVVAEQHRRPDLRVEDDVVLAHEVVGLGVLVVPPGAPGVRVAGPAGPLDGRRQVADHRVEPDVDPLVVAVPPAVERHGDAPVEVAGDRPRLEVVEQVERELEHVRPPVAFLGLQPGAERVGERGQVEEVVLLLDEQRGLAVDLRLRVDQVGRVELVAAVVALVAARARVAADRAGALDVAVGQRAAGGRRDRAERGLREDVPVLQQGEEDLLGDRVVVSGRGPGEQVIAHAEVGEVVADDTVVPVDELPGGDAFLVRLDLDRGAVLVGAGDHQHLVARHPLVPAEHVARDARSRRRGRCAAGRWRRARPPRSGCACGLADDMVKAYGLWRGRR